MKRFICLFLAIILFASCAYADSPTIYKSDLFFMYLGNDWKLVDTETGMYQNGNQFLILKETPYNTGGKGLVTLFGKLAYESAILELFGESDYLSSEVIEKDGHIIPIIVLSHENFEWSVISFVLGENSIFLAAYVDRSKPGYHVLKDRMVQIMLNASAR